MPLHPPAAKRGFTNIFKKEYAVVNLSELERFDGERRRREALRERGLVKGRHARVKVLGDGELGKALTVVADKFSKSAREKIEAAGGTLRGAPVRDSRELPQHLRDPGPAQAGAVHVRRCSASTASARTSRRPGVDPVALARVLQGAGGRVPRVRRPLLRAAACAALGVRARHHAVHLRLDHPAAPHGRLAVPREAVEGRGDGAPQDHPVHPLRHGRCSRSSRRSASPSGSKRRPLPAARRSCRAVRTPGAGASRS